MVTVLSLMVMATGLVAGVFYGFSDFVMRSLGAIPQAQGSAAMVSINRVILRASFVPMLLALGPLSIAVAVWAYLSGTDVAMAWVWVASGLYLVGVLGVTIVGNVPLNNRLDRAVDASAVWAGYRRPWTRLNSLRTVAAALASMCYLQAALAIAGHAVT
jgi:uncharacterized membrane protein